MNSHPGAVLGNVLAEAPERLTALSKQQLQEASIVQLISFKFDDFMNLINKYSNQEPEEETEDVRAANSEPKKQYKRPRYKPRYKL